MMDHINVQAVEVADKCSGEVQQMAVAWSDSQGKAAYRVGVSKEKLIAQICNQAGLCVRKVGKSRGVSIAHRVDDGQSSDMRSADEVRCPLGFEPLVGTPPLLCLLQPCDAYSTDCYIILAAAEDVLEKERPP